MIEIKPTSKGLLVGEFKDRYGAECTIQESSLAGEDCMWLGISVNSQGEHVALGRMHLTKDMARDLIPLLRHFVRTGRLGNESSSSWVIIGTWVLGICEPHRGVRGRIVSVSNGQVTVQNDRIPGTGGLSFTWEEQFDLFWEPTEDPEPRQSALDSLLEDNDD